MAIGFDQELSHPVLFLFLISFLFRAQIEQIQLQGKKEQPP
jgi:hypothetical protein